MKATIKYFLSTIIWFFLVPFLVMMTLLFLGSNIQDATSRSGPILLLIGLIFLLVIKFMPLGKRKKKV